MEQVLKHWPRIAVTLLPMLFALLHASHILRMDLFQRFDEIIYDLRLRATMPKTLDERIVIVDLDEKSLAEVGRWPWGRNRVADLVEELMGRQRAALIGFDVVFAEPDESSGLSRLKTLAQNELRDQPSFLAKLHQVEDSLDYDAQLAKAIEGRAIVLGFYLTSDRQGRTAGVLPRPVIEKRVAGERSFGSYSYDGYGANLARFAKAAPLAGFFNPIVDVDGVVRSLPLIVEYKGDYYESLSLAMFRALAGSPSVSPGIARARAFGKTYQGLESIILTSHDNKKLAIPVDDKLTIPVPFRGFGGPTAGSYRYVSAADLLAKRLAVGELKGKIILLGTTAPGLQDLRATPVGGTYPGVEMHANVISGLLDGKLKTKPDYVVGYEVATLVLAGLLLAIALPLLTAPRAVALSAGVITGLIGINFWFYSAQDLVLPLAAALVMGVTAFALNMSYGYFVESRSKRELAHLFGTYVPPELVDEMVKNPDSYSMKAANKDLTVMFCDMRGFTKMSEHMEPVQLQELLNTVFSRLTTIIRGNRGTIDKYMGDCVMAFWGAPVETKEHAQLAVKTALEMANEMRTLNQENRDKGLPEIGVGIGLNTGSMCVGDMGSDIRRSYTVIGDAVNLGSRLEGLSKVYGVDIVVSESTRKLAPDFAWQELDKVRVKGKATAVTIYWPLAPAGRIGADQVAELKTWGTFLKAYRNQEWEQCDLLLMNLLRLNAKKYLYQLYSERVASMRVLPFDPQWDGATNFETK